MNIFVLLRAIVLSMTCLAGYLLIHVYAGRWWRGRKIYVGLAVLVYLSVYWSIVYRFFLEY